MTCRNTCIPLSLVLALCAAAVAIQPGRWVHNSEADFESGKSERVVVTNLGDIKLANAITTIAQIPEQAGIIYDLEPGNKDDLIIAAGPEAKLLRKRGDKIETIVSLPNEQVFALDHDSKGRIIAAVSGTTSRLAILDGDKLTTLIDLGDVRYVWDMIVDGHFIYLATGIEGKLLRVDLNKAEDLAKHPVQAALATHPASQPKDEEAQTQAATEPIPQPANPAIEVLLDATQANLLCLARDKKGRIYAGSDTDGLIYRVTFNRDGGVDEVFVVYDAAEPEIGALLVTADDTVYAGTADAEQAKPGRLNEASESQGRPEVPDEADKQPAKQPNPADIPQVPPPANPIGEPNKDSEEQLEESDDLGAADNIETGRHLTAAAPNTVTQKSTNLINLVNDAPVALDDKPVIASSPEIEPTKAQHDELREVIRKRLEAARKSGVIPMGANQGRPTNVMGGPIARGKPQPGAAGPAMSKGGNAIYRITPDGFVNEVFRESVMILRMIEDPADAGRLLVATGNKGQIFRVNPAAGETTILARLEPQQIPAMLPTRDGIILGTANPAHIIRLDSGFAKDGTYTSIVMDATQISLWGKLQFFGTVPAGSSVLVETRSGNVQDPEQAAWTAWAKSGTIEHDEHTAPLTPIDLPIESPPARFLQYRLTLSGKDQATPVVDRIAMAYVLPNLKPAINSITAAYADETSGAAEGGPGPNRAAARPGAVAAEPEPQTAMNIEWESNDPNNDRLKYVLEYQPAGTKVWLPLAKDLDAATFEWQTRRVPDGRYIIRITASDASDNPGGMALSATRYSDPVLVDNTPPSLKDLKAIVDKGVVKLSGEADDKLSNIRSIFYGVDSTEQWQPVLSSDLIFDSTSERFSINISGLSAGQHIITVRVLDARNNAKYESVVVEVK